MHSRQAAMILDLIKLRCFIFGSESAEGCPKAVGRHDGCAVADRPEPLRLRSLLRGVQELLDRNVVIARDVDEAEQVNHLKLCAAVG